MLQRVNYNEADDRDAHTHRIGMMWLHRDAFSACNPYTRTVVGWMSAFLNASVV
jgi:hypothetical protein